MDVTTTIRDFANDRVRMIRDWDHSTAARVQEEYQAAGYHPVELGTLGLVNEWQECHRWCREHIGEDHYSWTGSTFWFETDKAAVLFALRWT